MTVRGHDFRSLRQWRGSQSNAFEEFCYQLRDPVPAGAELVKTGNPDGGLEWYVTLCNGGQWGWQAKFTFDIGSLLQLMERSLKTVVRKRPKCRKLTFCIPFDLPDAPGTGEWKSARQKFEDRKNSWRSRIPGAERVGIELWSEGDLLGRLVRHPGQRGMERFFWDREVFSPAWCAEHVATTVRAAGGRYSPSLHVDLPMAFALEGLALSEAYWKKFRAVRGAVVIAATKLDVAHYTGLGVATQLRRLIHVLDEWRRDVPAGLALPVRLDRDRLLDATRVFEDAVNEAYPSDPAHRRRTATERQARTDERRRWLQHCLRTLGDALGAFERLLRSGATEAAERGVLVLTGEAGQGKTHLFCDAAKRAVQAGLPAIVLLAGRLSGRHVWSEVAEQLGLGQTGSEEVLGAMQAAAQASNAPFVLLIDALNEAAEPKAWQEELPGLLAEIAQNPWISLGVSVRSTFLPVVFPVEGLSGVAEIEHRGFERRELEATERFFDAFGLEQPPIPLLTPEFTNPLFLKLYCEGLSDLGLNAPPAGETHVSDVFERYLKAKAARIVARLNLDPAARPVEASIDAFCNALAGDNRDSLARHRSAQIINEFAPGRDQWPDTLLGQLLSEGVLTADVVWRRDAAAKHVDVVRFTYQRFADHRVASTLLESLNDDPLRLREALAAGKPLRRRVLKAPGGWIDALSVQIPERFNLELLDAAGWRLRPFRRRRWERTFVRSISTRRPCAVTKRSRELLSQVARRSPDLRMLVRETLLTVAPHPEHPLNANLLHERLKRLPMPERDVVWSIPTYAAFDDGGALDRIIRWAARGPYPDCPGQVLGLAALPIVWTFTSPNRWMRDYATKALARLLSGSLAALPSLIRRFEGVDDPYVIERLAVVSHGAVLCGGRKAPRVAVAVAVEMKRVAFAETQVLNIITRDAVRGVYEWCFRHRLIEEREYTEVLPPYGADPPRRSRTEIQLEHAYDREEYHGKGIRWPYVDLFMSIFSLGDFGRYVIESKVRYFSKHALSSARPSAARQHKNRVIYPAEAAKCWVFERVLSLGWTPERFARFDQFYGRQGTGRSEHKAERFGKKYQWIAMRELLARIADNFHMVDDFDDQPITYAGPWQFYGRDIDPTLPASRWDRGEDGERELGPTFVSDDEDWWMPPGPNYSRNDPPVGDGWAVDHGDIPDFEPLVRREEESGPRWVVLHAHYTWKEEIAEDEEWNSRRRRELWSHISSWLVQPADRDVLVEYLEQHSLMGRWMPEGRGHTDAAYLGELPWALAAREYADGWTEMLTPYDWESTGLQVYPTWAEYCWEGNVLDCSIEHGVSAWLPATWLCEAGELRWVSGTRRWCMQDGSVAAQYCSSGGRSALLVREDWLKRTLRKTGHSVVFGCVGEKELFEAGYGAGLLGDWTQINATASLAGSRWYFGERRFERRFVAK